MNDWTEKRNGEMNGKMNKKREEMNEVNSQSQYEVNECGRITWSMNVVNERG